MEDSGGIRKIRFEALLQLHLVFAADGSGTMLLASWLKKCWPHLLLVLPVLLLSGCQPQATAPQTARLTDGGLFFLYLHPLTADTSRLRFVVDEVAAIGEDGALQPLTLSLSEITLENIDRQRLFASGRLPAGKYRGLAVTIKGAWVMTEEGEVALLPPEEAVEVPIHFSLPEGKAKLFEMIYHHDGSIRRHVLFVPDLTAYVPDLPLLERVGYVSCTEAGYLVLFDRESMRVYSVVAIDKNPAGIVVDQVRKRIYVSVQDDDQVEILDLRTGETVGNIPLQPGDMPGRLALTPDGLHLLVVNRDSKSVSFLSTLSQIELERVTVGEDPQFVLCDRNGKRAYVFNSSSDTMSVLDLDQPRVMATIITETGPFWGALNRNGTLLYILYHDSPFVSVFDTQAMAFINRLEVGIGVSTLLVDPFSDLIYLGWLDEKRVDIYAPLSLQPVDFLKGPGSPVDMVIDNEENRLLLATHSLTGVVALDLTSRQSAGFVETGAAPASLDIAGARR